MISEPKIIASESCHYYDRQGNPVYEVPNKSKPGTFRPVTIRDAKRLDLVPSVTTVLSILAKPSLSAWKENQILLSAATSPYDRNIMDAMEWASKVLDDAQSQSKIAAEKGTDIHAAIEKYLISGETDEYSDFVVPVVQKLLPLCRDVKPSAEKSFAHPSGFGGKVDFNIPQLIIDFKTKDGDLDKKLAYDEHCYQLAAYRLGLNLPKAVCQNWFISTTTPGLISIHEWTESELNKGEIIFLRTLDLWKLLKL